METFRANEFDGKSIEMCSSQDISKLYAILEKEENFVLEYTDAENHRAAKLMIGTEIFPKVKTGDFTITAKGNQVW